MVSSVNLNNCFSRMFAKCVILLLSVGCYHALPTGGAAKGPNLQNETFYLWKEYSHNGYILARHFETETEFLVSMRYKKSHRDALLTCLDFGMKLLTVDSKEKNEIVKDLIKTYTKEGPFWMAASRLSDGRTWRWANEKIVTYSNWDDREPNNAKGDEYCVEVYHREALWDDQRCSAKIYFICEAPKIDRKTNAISSEQES